MTGFDDLDSTEPAGGPDEPEGESSTDNDDTVSAPSDAESEIGDTLDLPAFSFDETSQEQIYPRETTYEEFRRFVDYELKRELDEESVPDVSGRELDDALLRLAMAHGEEYKELVKDARR